MVVIEQKETLPASLGTSRTPAVAPNDRPPIDFRLVPGSAHWWYRMHETH